LGKKWEDLQFRKDTNYGALYAESLIELHPWALYDNHYAPTSPDTDKIIKVLDAAKAADLNGVGWNHYWIHVAEAGPTPKAAEPSANLLQTLVQASGHLVHMPSHIYLLIGDYNKSLVSNVNAAGADVTEYKKPCSGSYKDYSLNPYCPQLYYGHYLSHNYFFGSVSATFSGQSAKALALACDTREHVEHFVTNEPSLQRYMTAPLMTLVVNRNWKTIINKKQQPEPPSSCYIQPPFTEETGCHILLSIWYWARGMAYASLGDPKQAVTEYNGMNAEMGQVAHHPPTSWGNNDALSVLGIGKAMLFARYEWADGSQQQAIKALVAARDAEDELTYDEPPQWFAPVREALGGAYLQLETPQGFKDAERTFDEELKRRPTSGRALYGKMRALQLQGQSAKAAVAEDDFCRVWKNIADYTMTDADLWPAKNVEGDSYSATTCGKPKKAPSLNNCPVPPSSPASP
jgi:hypothetical protein